MGKSLVQEFIFYVRAIEQEIDSGNLLLSEDFEKYFRELEFSASKLATTIRTKLKKER